MADGLQNIGNILAGFGAGVQGRGTQFLQGLEQQREVQRGLSEERKQALVQDVAVGLDHLESGRTSQAIQLFEQRLSLLGQDPDADPEETRSTLEDLRAGKFDKVKDNLKGVVRAAQIRGLLPDTPTSKFLEIKDNKAFFRTQTGVEAQDIKGLEGAVPKPDQKQINVLRKNLNDVTKTFKTTEEATKRIRSVGKKGTAASDMAVVFSFMKILDPGSTVREGEFATAQNAAGIPERIVNAYNNARAGTILGDDQRKDFLNQAESLFQSQRESTDNQIENILQQSDEDAIPRQRVFGKKRLEAFEERARLRVPPPGGDQVQADGAQAQDLSQLSIDELIALRQQQAGQ